MQSFADIKHCIYINLDRRTDRRKHVETELALIGIYQPIRFPAIPYKNGAIGCSLSHLRCLCIAKKYGWPHVMIVEDDILFLDKPLVWLSLAKFFKTRKVPDDWDVLLLGGNNISHVRPTSPHSVQVQHCQTTTGYIVQQHYYDTLISNIALGIGYYMRYPRYKHAFSIDKFWMRLQERHKWFLLLPLTVTQYDNYSDIEKRPVSYNKVMLLLNK